MCSFLILILYVAIAFLISVNSSTSDKNIVDLIKDIECGLVSDNVAKELRLDKLCSIPQFQLEDIKTKSIYDTSPLLCSQFYEINLKLCNIKTKLNISDCTLPNSEKGVKEFMSNLRIKNSNVISLCNTTKQWKSAKEESSLIDYFYKLIGNETICRRLCSSVVDGNVTDLCNVIIWQQTNFERINVPNVTNDEGKLEKMARKFSESLEQKTIGDVSEKDKKNSEKNTANTVDEYNKPREILDSKAMSFDVPSNGPPTTFTESFGIPPESIGKKLSPELPVQQKQDDNTKSDVTKLDKAENDSPNKVVEKLETLSVVPDVEGEFKDNIQEIPRVGDNVDKGFEQENNDQDSPYTPDNVDIDDGFVKPQESGVNAYRGGDRLMENEDSHFFTYFVSMGVVCGILYILFHNKKKILALAVEGRRSRNHGGSRRRPNTAAYSKLDSNLEEAMVSNVSQASVTHVLY